ncbi:MAG TPA: hypothetical protein PKH16_09935 [Aequorivita sp.]|nr:hypothetical protein [Aequorivita sp.]
MKAIDFLRKKKMLDKKCTEFEISGDFGKVSLPDLLEEFGDKKQVKLRAFKYVLLVLCFLSTLALIGFCFYIKN